MAKPTIKTYVEAGSHFTEMTKQQAEALVKSLVKTGDVRRRDAEQMLQAILSRGRETSDRLSALVQSEVAKQLKALSERFEDIESRLESLASSVKDGIVSATGGMTGTDSAPPPASTPSPSATGQSTTKSSAPQVANKPVSKATGKKAAAKTTAKKATAKKGTSKKTSRRTAKKSRAKKSSKQGAAKKTAAGSSGSSGAVGSSGVRKVSASRPSATSG